MVEFLMDPGKITRCMDMVCSLGLMVEDMKGNISKTKNKVRAPSSGQMDVDTLVVGLMGSSMDKELTYRLMEGPDKANGTWEGEQDG